MTFLKIDPFGRFCMICLNPVYTQGFFLIFIKSDSTIKLQLATCDVLYTASLQMMKKL